MIEAGSTRYSLPGNAEPGGKVPREDGAFGPALALARADKVIE